MGEWGFVHLDRVPAPPVLWRSLLVDARDGGRQLGGADDSGCRGPAGVVPADGEGVVPLPWRTRLGPIARSPPLAYCQEQVWKAVQGSRFCKVVQGPRAASPFLCQVCVIVQRSGLSGALPWLRQAVWAFDKRQSALGACGRSERRACSSGMLRGLQIPYCRRSVCDRGVPSAPWFLDGRWRTSSRR